MGKVGMLFPKFCLGFPAYVKFVIFATLEILLKSLFTIILLLLSSFLLLLIISEYLFVLAGNSSPLNDIVNLFEISKGCCFFMLGV
jgi:hypothetical protein